MKKMKLVIMLFFATMIATTAYAQELKSVSFDDYLKAFDYKERKYMKIEIPELMDLYKKGMVQIIDIRFSEEYQTYNFSFIQ